MNRIVILMSFTAVEARPLSLDYKQPKAQGYFKLDHVEKYMRANQVAVTGRESGTWALVFT